MTVHCQKLTNITRVIESQVQGLQGPQEVSSQTACSKQGQPWSQGRMETAKSLWVTSSIFNCLHGESFSLHPICTTLVSIYICLLHSYCAFVSAELHWVPLRLLLQRLQVPVDCNPAFKLLNGSSSRKFGVICKSNKTALQLILRVIDKDVRAGPMVDSVKFCSLMGSRWSKTN